MVAVSSYLALNVYLEEARSSTVLYVHSPIPYRLLALKVRLFVKPVRRAEVVGSWSAFLHAVEEGMPSNTEDFV